jgi:hypothetical protein
VSQGCHADDEEVEDMIFLESTREALLTFQAIQQLPETGMPL